MKYIALTELLHLNLDEIAQLDTNRIIRLQKQLKAKAMLDDSNNLGEISQLIEDLKNDDLRACYIFVEKHLWLKHLITGKFEDINHKDISINESSTYETETLKYFLNSYLKENLIVFISDRLSKGKHEHILKVLYHNILFTEEINQIIINFFKARLNYAIAYIEQDKLKEKQFPVAFISNKIFINCLNIYPDAFNEEIKILNSKVIDVYNRYRRNANNSNFKFSAKTMVAFSQLDTSDIFLKDNLESNAKIAKEYSYSSRRNTEKSRFGSSSWSIVLIIFLIIRVIFWIGKGLSNDSQTDYNPINFDTYNINSSSANDYGKKNLDSIIKEIQKGNVNINDLKNTLGENYNPATNNVEETVIETSEIDDEEPLYKEDKRKLISHIRFLYSLKYKYYKKPRNSTGVSKLNSSTNPYPKTFYLIPGKPKVSSKDNITLISNRSNQDLIVFRLKDGVDQSIYIPKNKNKYIFLKQRDCLAFYTGTDFVTSKFSHFKNNGRLSELYKINHLEKGNSTIVVFPPKKSRETTSSKRVKYDAYTTDDIRFWDMITKPLFIDELYKDYYNNYYKKN